MVSQKNFIKYDKKYCKKRKVIVYLRSKRQAIKK